MAKTKLTPPVPYDTQSAAAKIGCSIGTLRDYVRRGYLKPQRTPSGHLIFFDAEIEAARAILLRNKTR